MMNTGIHEYDGAAGGDACIACNTLKQAEDPSRKVTLQAAPDLAVTLSFSSAPKPVGLALGVEIHPPDDDGVEGSVELTIAASVKSVADDLTRRSGDRCHAS